MRGLRPVMRHNRVLDGVCICEADLRVSNLKVLIWVDFYADNQQRYKSWLDDAWRDVWLHSEIHAWVEQWCVDLVMLENCIVLEVHPEYYWQVSYFCLFVETSRRPLRRIGLAGPLSFISLLCTLERWYPKPETSVSNLYLRPSLFVLLIFKLLLFKVPLDGQT